MPISRSTSVGSLSLSSQTEVGAAVATAFAPLDFSSIETAETWSDADWCQMRCSAGSKPRLYAIRS
jgi:hypothetical protein